MKALSPLLVIAIPASLALAACQSEPATEASPSATASDGEVEAPPAAPRDLPRVTLMPSGLAVAAGPGGGAPVTIEFGTGQEQAIAAMRAARGLPEMSRNVECGAGAMDFAAFGPVTLNFVDGKLAGWSAEGNDNIVTSDGIRPGITLDDIRQERPVEAIDSTLDGEFAYTVPDGGTIGGFADKAGKVLSLHAGTNCFFR